MKKCIKCKQVLPVDRFYSHPTNKDGRFSVCIECHKYRVRMRRLIDPKVGERDRLRSQRPEVKAQRAKHARIYKETPEYKIQAHARNEVRKALDRGNLRKLPCEVCGAGEVEAHHPDYSKPLDVMWLCRKHHNDIHHNTAALSGKEK